MNILHAALRWLRIEDENGVLSITTVTFAVGIVCLFTAPVVGVVVFAMGLAAVQLNRYRRTRLAELALRGANRHSLAQLAHKGSADVEALAATVADLQKKVYEIATPERMQAWRDATGRKRG